MEQVYVVEDTVVYTAVVVVVKDTVTDVVVVGNVVAVVAVGKANVVDIVAYVVEKCLQVHVQQDTGISLVVVV